MREHTPSVLVATLSAAFGVSLLQVTGALATMISSARGLSESGMVAFLLALVGSVFIVIAVYVGAIVTANTFATIIAGRTRTIALMRLIGATASSQRRAVAREGLLVGVAGSVFGLVIGTAATFGLVRAAVAMDFVPDLAYDYLPPVIALPLVAVVLTTWLASWIGSRRVLDVSPIQATGGAQEVRHEVAAGRRGRNATAITLIAIGLGLLALGVAAGFATPLGVLPGLVGGILSFTGLVVGAQYFMPPALRLVGLGFGRGAAARLAAENALRYPERSSRTTIGLVIGVTLVTTFAVAAGSYQEILTQARLAQPEVYAGTDQLVTVTVGIFSALLGFSALIAAVGMVNNLSLSVLQRTRELGLLRALGFTNRQLRTMVVAESAQLTIAALLVGLALGTFYGWAGAQSLLGSMYGSPGLIVPVLPLWLIGTVVAAAALLTVVASITPTRRATKISPVVALAVD
ncbi:ABC transporter permease [Herbiconiux sp. CPCC 205763]|uniref:ABC transporter permease n=1 Tax=Herbiconiux aconitum TaxID=2970913 RepID=A0ABT2GPQ0_9MICO|nr:ABC transporter permease [Herbiconiux aconitum]MCS5718148.1 ABC transporter permease [Herbiconiux aconitum]